MYLEPTNSYALEKIRLQGSLLEFTKIFYLLRTGRDFHVSEPIGRESHVITVMRELMGLLDMKTRRLLINIPPGHFKSTMLQHFIAWAMSQYPDSQFIYVSYSKSLAEKHTSIIKQIMEMPHYIKCFGVEVRKDSSAKGNFKTTAGGSVMAFGSSGSITGQDAGLPGVSRFSGAVIMDDMHKPDEVHSDTIRQSVIDNYNETIKPRARSPIVPFVFIGQRLHEYDLPAFMLAGEDGYVWDSVILKAFDSVGNVLCPDVISKEQLLIEQDKNNYVYSAQYQQDPQPAGGGIYKPEWFPILDSEPDIIETFLTVDTAETDKSYNDATVFSFWGLYKIIQMDRDTGLYGVHWIDCTEIRVEPKDLQAELFQFYAECMMHKVKPTVIAIEKKSTGTTLASSVGAIQGLEVIDIGRNATRMSKDMRFKTARFLEAQPYVASKRVSFTRYAKHVDRCIEHCRKITANNTHRFDDIADTMYDAIKLALIDKIFIYRVKSKSTASNFTKELNTRLNRRINVENRRYS